MGPKKQDRARKKQKLEPAEQTATQRAIDKLAALDLTLSSAPSTLASDLISSLRPGWGLLGTDKEEEEYYVWYVDSIKNDQEQQATDPKIGGADSKDASSNESCDDEEVDEQALEPYKHKVKKKTAAAQNSDDEEIDLGDYEKLEFGRDYIEVNGEHIHATVFFGTQWTQHIHDLYAVPPVEHPENMDLILHDHQLKGAAQMHYLCNSQFRGGILADGMGVGKTHTAICAMFLVKDDPGFSMVVAPKTLCLQWVAAIEGAWQEGYGMRAYLLEGPSMTAHELLALGVDVVVCSYDQVDASERAQRGLLAEIELYSNDQTGAVKKPTRPNAVLHSSFWREMNLPIKRLVLDEAQLVNKRHGVRHGALKNLFYHSVILLSGTPAHNKWHNFSGLVDFLQGHPFADHNLFLRAFASLDYEGKIDRPDLPRMRLIQRFIQAFTIARPSDILKLKECTRYRASFHIRKAHQRVIDGLMAEYFRLLAMRKDEASGHAVSEVDPDVKKALSYAVQAQIMSLSPWLLEESEHRNLDDFVDLDEDDPVSGYASADRATKGGERRDEWLQKVRERGELIDESDRVRQFLLVYKQLRRTNPDQKILVFSQYLKFLDILAEALKRAFGVQALRFDGTVSQGQRVKVQQDFKDADSKVPLLMTAGAGAFGLNVTAASIIIQCEVWWNLSVEWQAICRIWRQNQTNAVLAVQLYGTESWVDQEISRVQIMKSDISSELMEPIIRRPGEEPDIRDFCFPLVVAPWSDQRRGSAG